MNYDVVRHVVSMARGAMVRSSLLVLLLLSPVKLNRKA